MKNCYRCSRPDKPELARGNLELDQTALYRVKNRLEPVMGAEFLVDGMEVVSQVGKVMFSSFAICAEFFAAANNLKMRSSCSESGSMGEGLVGPLPTQMTCFDTSSIRVKACSNSLRSLMS